MDEVSWRAKLAKSNINITSVQYLANHKVCVVCYEFPYHPKPGQVKWVKTADEFIGAKQLANGKPNFEDIIKNGKLPPVYLEDVIPSLLARVLELRKELER